MTALTILTTAWVSFAVKRQATDISKPFEQRLAFDEMLNSFYLVLSEVVDGGMAYADTY